MQSNSTQSPHKRHVLIAGASGVIGEAALEHFAASSAWQITALSRRKPVVPATLTFTHITPDLNDSAAVTAALAQLPPVTDLIYAAVSEAPGLAPGWREPAQIEKNGTMFANLLGPLAETGHLQHVCLLQGTKAYGVHVHPVTVPLREDTPRDPHPNFYWLQEDCLREAAQRRQFGFTIFRPQILLGAAPGAAMNPVAAIGTYAALCHEQGLPFTLPGTSTALWEMVDAGLLAEAMAWACVTPAAKGQIFNITNGDLFVLRHAWPTVAAALGLTAGPGGPESFASLLRSTEMQTSWRQIALRHGLIEPSLTALLGQSDHYLDLLLAPRIAAAPSPALLSTIKLRQAGFSSCRDSQHVLLTQLERMMHRRLLPMMEPL